MRKILLLLSMILLVVAMSGCQWFDNEAGQMMSELKGRSATTETYDEDGNKIDSIHGNSIHISRDTKFDENQGKDSKKKSKVLLVSIGDDEFTHVGSSMILYEDGLHNVFDDYVKKVNINNVEPGTPIINNVVHEFKNFTVGKARVILIRSQSGKPIATFAGNKVSYFATNIPNTTGIQIDGKYLFIYQCDYTIYDTSLLK